MMRLRLRNPLHRPRTLRGLLLVFAVLLALPLLLAVGYAGLTLDQLTRQSRDVVAESVQTTQENQRLATRLGAAERNLRQYAVLQDPELMTLAAENTAESHATVHLLSELAHGDASTAMLASMRTRIATLLPALSIGEEAPPESAAAMAEQLAALGSDATALAREMRSEIDARLRALEGAARDTRQRLFWQTALLVPGLLALLVIFSISVLRPLREMDSAIRALGDNRVSTPISIRGPQDLKALGERLEWLRRRLEELAREKNRFLRHMSHELKTPLANIREGTDLLLDGSVGELAPRQQEVTEILRENGLRLQQLIENLLSFSAWQNRNATLELTDVSLPALIGDVLKQQQLMITAQRLRVKPAIGNITLHADYGKLRLIMDNLLSNAVKYSPRNGVVHVRARVEGDHCIIDVADDGPGIPPAERARVFEAFFQGSTRPNTRVGGSGIGLSVVLECVLAHDGQVEVVDELYRGAHLRVTLPLRVSGTGTDAPLEARASG